MPKKPPLLDRPGEGSYSRYDDYGHVEYRDYEEGRSFAHERRSGPPHRGVHKVILFLWLWCLLSYEGLNTEQLKYAFMQLLCLEDSCDDVVISVCCFLCFLATVWAWKQSFVQVYGALRVWTGKTGVAGSPV